MEDCLNDIFDNTTSKNHNDKLSLLYELNKVNNIAVKTGVGLTDRENMPLLVQQGGTWGPILCSNSIDMIGKKCRDRGRPGKTSSPTGILVFPSKTYCKMREIFH